MTEWIHCTELAFDAFTDLSFVPGYAWRAKMEELRLAWKPAPFSYRLTNFSELSIATVDRAFVGTPQYDAAGDLVFDYAGLVGAYDGVLIRHSELAGILRAGETGPALHDELLVWANHKVEKI